MQIGKSKLFATYEVSLLKSQIYRAMNSYIAHALEPYDLSPSEWTLLGVLHGHKSLPPSEIAQLLGVKPPVVTAVLKGLETKKMVRKSQPHKDARYILVALTDYARKVIGEAETKMQGDFKIFMKGIKTSDIRKYLYVLNQISQRLNDRQKGE
jgi:MarR family transcriptional regulator, transcriptional regulator for hemolysin